MAHRRVPVPMAGRALFDRSAEYAAIVDDGRALRDTHSDLDAGVAMRRLQTLSRRLDQVTGTDFFPGEARRQALAELDALRATESDDDTLLERAMEVFDWVLTGFRGQLD